MPSTHKWLVLTSGEPAGIGVDLCIMYAQSYHGAPWLVLGDAVLLQARATQLGLPCRIHVFVPNQSAWLSVSDWQAGDLWVFHVPVCVPVTTGVLAAANAPYVLALLDRALQGMSVGEWGAMVTLPVHKGIITDSGIAFSGHTEYLAAKPQTEKVVMMLTAVQANGVPLRVALATTHLPLAEVASAVTAAELRAVLAILLSDLRSKFGCAKPRVLVAGLNPHAGEGGHLGDEEITVIEPVLNEFRAKGEDIIGCLPADTLFQPKYLDTADAVLAMYHDQGLPLLKYVGFGQAVNVTLGLPYLRTSVDHGTALDLAGTGRVSLGSLQAACALAASLL